MCLTLLPALRGVVALFIATAPASPAGIIMAGVGIPPMEYFVERVGGPYVSARSLLAPGRSPHTFEPTPKQIAALAAARVYFSLGFPFEKRLAEKLSQVNPLLTVVDAARGIRFLPMVEGDGEGEGRGGESDPHVWLSPKNAAIIASNIRDGLSRVDPRHAGEFRKNAAAFQADLRRLDAQLESTLAPFRGREFFVYHAAFGYFGDAYGMTEVAVESAGKEPGPRHLAALIERAHARGIKIIFVQPQFSSKSAQEVARAIGGAVVPMDDLARDYLKNLAEMAAQIKEAVRAATPTGP